MKIILNLMACFGCLVLAAAQPAPDPAVPAVPANPDPAVPVVPDAGKIVIPRGLTMQGIPLSVLLEEYFQVIKLFYDIYIQNE